MRQITRRAISARPHPSRAACPEVGVSNILPAGNGVLGSLVVVAQVRTEGKTGNRFIIC
jgi:hypothetical protein